MTENRKIRLIQVAKEFKVGINTIVDSLLKKGVNIDGSPNSLVSPEVYAILEKEFGSNRTSGNERNIIKEKISLGKKESVSLEAGKKEEPSEEQEVIIKSNVINVKDEIQQPKILGKIDLGGKKPAEQKKEAPKATTTPAKEQPARVEPKQEQPKEQPQPAAEEKVFRPNQTQLSGPQILGTMDVSGMVPGGKHKRKRLDKEKVDVNKQGKGGQQQSKQEKKNKQQQNGNQQQNNNQQPKAGEGRRNKHKDKKHQPKPVVRPEVSDEEV